MSAMIVKNNCEVDFRRYNSINSLLGFEGKIYTSGLNESENIVNILTINSILVNIDINPHNLLYLPITADTIHSITISLTDRNGDELNLRGENLSMRFHLREISKYLEFKK